jgi:hypothetical protein
MKNKINNVAKLGVLLSLITITSLCVELTASAKPSRGGGGHGGGMPYPTASTVSQLIADINYANQVGGSVTINLAPGATFTVTSANNSTDGGNGFPVIGGPIALNLTITGNGDAIERIQVNGGLAFRFFDVAKGSSLTLNNVKLKKGGIGAIINYGTVNVINSSVITGSSNVAIINYGGTVTIAGSTLSDNLSGGYGGAIYNNFGTVTINGSVLSSNSALSGGGIYNDGGTVTIGSSTLSGNAAYRDDDEGNGGGIYNAGGTVTIFHSNLSNNSADPNFGSGGGIYNDVNGDVIVGGSSSIIGNTASDSSGDVSNAGELFLDSTSTIGILSGNPAIPFEMP